MTITVPTDALPPVQSDTFPAPSKDSPLWLVLDYDGTLTPIVARPEDAMLDDTMAATLANLSAHEHIRWALLSGRNIAQLQGFMAPHALTPDVLCGLHGGEMQVWQANSKAYTWAEKPSDSYPVLSNAFMAHVTQALGKAYPPEQWLGLGLAIEEKHHCFALHYRQAADDVAQQAEAIFRQHYQESPEIQAQFRLQAGKKVIEIVPTAFNKGAGIEKITSYWQPFVAGNAQPTLLFVGDDKTDDAGFTTVARMGGAGIHVGGQATTGAQYGLADVAAVGKWLHAIIG